MAIRCATPIDVIIVVARCTTVLVIDAGRCKFDRDFLIVRVPVHATVDGRVLLLGRHFIKIFEYTNDRQLNGTYRHYLCGRWVGAFLKYGRGGGRFGGGERIGGAGRRHRCRCRCRRE